MISDTNQKRGYESAIRALRDDFFRLSRFFVEDDATNFGNIFTDKRRSVI